MENKQDLAPARREAWTRIDDYFVALALHRTARRKREPGPRRTQPEAPRFLLSTLPFLMLFGALLVIAVGIMVAAWPGAQPEPRRTAAEQELGTATKGWYQEAQREMNR